jgi:hypothetical protein
MQDQVSGTFQIKETRPIWAINVMVCILRSCWDRGGPEALAAALPQIFETGGSGRDNGREQGADLSSLLVRLGKKARERAPSDRVLLARLESGKRPPSLVSWENDLYRQLSAEYPGEGPEEGDPVAFARWATEATGVLGDYRAVLLLGGGRGGRTEVRLVQYGQPA